MTGKRDPIRPRKRLLNIEVDDVSFDEFLQHFDEGVLVTPNADHLVTLQENPDFYRVYQNADWVTVDSKIVLWISKLLGQGVRDKISGSDLLPRFCDFHKDNPDIKIFLLGAREGVAKRAMELMNEKWGREIVVGAHSPSMQVAEDEAESLSIIEQIEASGANVLAVGLGAPKQELWIDQYRNHFRNVRMFMAIGATIDFQAGEVDRAPAWMSEYGLEWLYRICQEPGRMWKRYLVRDLPVFWYAFKQMLGIYHNPFEKGVHNT